MEKGLPLLNTRPIHEQAYAALRDALTTGHLRPGQSLTMRSIAGQLGISVTPAREALQRLIAEGALELGAGRTIQVPVMTRTHYAEITEIRVRLETLAATSALPAVSGALVERLQLRSGAMQSAIREERFSDYLAENQHFHFGIYAAAGMPYLLQLIGVCWLRVGPWFNVLASEGQFHSTANDKHERIIVALKEGDRSALAGAVEDDIRDAYRLLVRQLP